MRMGPWWAPGYWNGLRIPFLEKMIETHIGYEEVEKGGVKLGHKVNSLTVEGSGRTKFWSIHDIEALMRFWQWVRMSQMMTLTKAWRRATVSDDHPRLSEFDPCIVYGTLETYVDSMEAQGNKPKSGLTAIHVI